MKEIRFFILITVSISLFIVSSYALGVKTEKRETPLALANSEPFPAVALTAKSAYIYDARTKTVLFAKDENRRLPLASLTKLMTALVAKDLSPEYGTVVITKDALAAEGDSGLKPGERWSLKSLLDFSLLASSNDGMRAVALALGALDRSDASTAEIIRDFVGEMNMKAEALDLKNTYFWNETGLDESELKGGAYGTARDMALLFEHIVAYHPELLEATRESRATIASLDGFTHAAKNTNILADRIPGFLGSKTGFTNTAGGNLVFAFDAEVGRPVIISILGSTESGRFEDAEKLIGAVLEHLDTN